jgi:hypothetical protein
MPRPGAPERSPYRMTGAIALAWFGMYVHNVADLPNLTLASPENVLPGIVWLLLMLSWLAVRSNAWPSGLLIAWGLLNLVGGFATVLPLPFLPFKPEQSLRHYLFHVLYAATQLPLLAFALYEVRRLRSRADGAA